jgi:cyclomaltodextrinase / maltogenic alpha-amylase / neopullulanase
MTPLLASAGRKSPTRSARWALRSAVNLYYGSEVAMEGGDDPEMRGPMAWERVAARHPALEWTKQLIALRKQQRALRVGDYRRIEAQNLIAFERYTDRAADTVLVIANPGEQPVQETLLVANSKLMDGTKFTDLLQPGQSVAMQSALIAVKLPPKGLLLLRPETAETGGYTNYKRVR